MFLYRFVILSIEWHNSSLDHESFVTFQILPILLVYIQTLQHFNHLRIEDNSLQPLTGQQVRNTKFHLQTLVTYKMKLNK